MGKYSFRRPQKHRFENREKRLTESQIRYETKVRVLRRDNCICYLCGAPIHDANHASIDHVKPRAKHGTDDEENLRACHVFCNTAKQDMTLEEFKAMAAIWAKGPYL